MSEAVSDEETSLGEDLAAAFEEIEESEETTGEAEDETTSETESEETEAEGGDEEDSSDEVEETSSSEDDDADDDDDDEEEAPAAAEDSSPAPASWSAENREEWSSLSPTVKAQVVKREREVEGVLRDSAEARKFTESFHNAIKPYEQTIQVEAGGDVMVATRNLMNIATGLRVGAPPQKAQLVAQIIGSYGVDLSILDDILSGQAISQPQGQTGTQEFRDPRVDQMLANQQSSRDADAQTSRDAISAFMADPVNEFAADVRNDMADLLELSGNRGQNLTLKQAYDKAVAMSDGIQKVLAGRSKANSEDAKRSLKRKKRASKTISGSPSGDGSSANNANTSMSDDVSAAWDAVASGEN